MTHTRHFDYVVIGGGSAGCAAAHGLAEDGNARVLLIEAGPDVRTLETMVPALVRKAVARFDWGYVSQPDHSRAGRREGWARGRILGGSSGINGMMFVRGAPADFDRWAAMQIPGWSWQDVAPHFRAMESSDRPGPDRGRAGPLNVRTVGRPHRLTRAFLDAAADSGFRVTDDYNAGDQAGFGLAQLSQRKGLRHSAADAFLANIRGADNFTLWDRCDARRLIFRGGRATHLLCTRDGVEHRVSADKFILSAGAVGTPVLLMHSGVGDPGELATLGIAPTIAAPQVGRNLIEHPLVRLVFETKVPSRNPRGLGQYLAEAADFALHREGMLASVFEAAGFVRSADHLDAPDIQYHFLPIGILDPVTHADPLLKVPSLTIYANLSHPTGRGVLKLASNDPRDAPLIHPNLLGGPKDIDALASGVRIARRIMAAPSMAAMVEREITPGPLVDDDTALRDHVRNNCEIAYHIAGTCRMGSDADAVVAPDLRLNGSDNVWIADASIFPDLISGNTNAACMMIGTRLARQLVDGARNAHAGGCPAAIRPGKVA